MSARKGVECEKCGKHFRDTYELGKHRQRKTPCAPILDPEDIPDEKKDKPKCRFCGRAFSTQTNVRQHMKKTCKIAPRNGDTSGMDKLYDHVLKRQEEKMQKMMEEMAALKTEVATLKAADGIISGASAIVVADRKEPKSTAVADRADVKNTPVINIKNALIDQSTGKSIRVTNKQTNVTLNIFGGESTAHITSVDVLSLLRALGPLGEDLCKPSERLILSMAMLIYSDERHPENITCYLPNKKGKDALIHGETGWEVMPVSLTLSPMASKSVDELFKKQPWPGLNGVPADLNLDEPTRILRYIADHEPDLVGGAASPSSELRAIPIRNREILEKVLAKLPRAGDP
jgi:hypothetical protein